MREPKSPEYYAWNAMNQRCSNPKHPKYPSYGGRGITICPEWSASFEAFLRDMGPRPSADHSLDRIDNDGDYTPENCRWATRIEQQSNRRVNRLLTFEGKTQTLAAWAREKGLHFYALRYRVEAGWPPEKALVPVEEKRKHSKRKVDQNIE